MSDITGSVPPDPDLIIIITLNRLYDVMLSLYAEVAGPDKAAELMQAHAEGHLFAPPPSYRSAEK